MRRNPLIFLFALPLLVVILFLRTRTPHPALRPDRSQESAEHRPQPKRSAQLSESCAALNLTCGSQYFSDWRKPSDGACSFRASNGYPVPDPSCTPGGVNPSVTEATLADRSWTTKCLRDCETSEAQKHQAYYWYSQPRPRGNNGPGQVCELDHLVPLNLGGSDDLGNIWPQCGPDNVDLNSRYFKQKDEVEDYLVNEVRTGHMRLNDAQRAIAQDWPRYMAAAAQYCASSGRC